MTDTDSTALTTALAYYQAWTGHDFDLAMTFISPEIVCHAPAGRLAGPAEFRAFMEPFTQIVTACQLLASFGDERVALLMYRAETRPVADAPGAEMLTVAAGLITEIRIVFDRLPFATARQAAAAG